MVLAVLSPDVCGWVINAFPSRTCIFTLARFLDLPSLNQLGGDPRVMTLIQLDGYINSNTYLRSS